MLVMNEVTGELREELATDEDVRSWMIAGVLEEDAVLRELEAAGEIPPSVRQKIHTIFSQQCLEGVWYKFAGDWERSRAARVNCTNHLCWIRAGSAGVSKEYVRRAFIDKNLFDTMLERARACQL